MVPPCENCRDVFDIDIPGILKAIWNFFYNIIKFFINITGACKTIPSNVAPYIPGCEDSTTDVQQVPSLTCPIEAIGLQVGPNMAVFEKNFLGMEKDDSNNIYWNGQLFVKTGIKNLESALASFVRDYNLSIIPGFNIYGNETGVFSISNQIKGNTNPTAPWKFQLFDNGNFKPVSFY